MTKYTRHSKEAKDKVIEMYNNHYSIPIISVQLNISKDTIDKILRRSGIKRNRRTLENLKSSEKHCNKCGTTKPINEFGKCKNLKYSNYESECLICRRTRKSLYKQNNLEKVRKTQREWRRKMRKENLHYKFSMNLRRRLNEIVRLQNVTKKSNFMNLLGCSMLVLLKHLESHFKDGMTWDNYGIDGWHIDHIRPCSSFDLSKLEEQKLCFHYSNLQPLWRKDNLSKGNKWLT